MVNEVLCFRFFMVLKAFGIWLCDCFCSVLVSTIEKRAGIIYDSMVYNFVKHNI